MSRFVDIIIDPYDFLTELHALQIYFGVNNLKMVVLVIFVLAN
jgi:hypothetical protein